MSPGASGTALPDPARAEQDQLQKTKERKSRKPTTYPQRRSYTQRINDGSIFGEHGGSNFSALQQPESPGVRGWRSSIKARTKQRSNSPDSWSRPDFASMIGLEIAGDFLSPRKWPSSLRSCASAECSLQLLRSPSVIGFDTNSMMLPRAVSWFATTVVSTSSRKVR